MRREHGHGRQRDRRPGFGRAGNLGAAEQDVPDDPAARLGHQREQPGPVAGQPRHQLRLVRLTERRLVDAPDGRAVPGLLFADRQRHDGAQRSSSRYLARALASLGATTAMQ